jgi:hypothetical protein
MAYLWCCLELLAGSDFHEKALIVKDDVAALVAERIGFALRVMLPSALSVSSLFGSSVHRMRSVFFSD